MLFQTPCVSAAKNNNGCEDVQGISAAWRVHLIHVNVKSNMLWPWKGEKKRQKASESESCLLNVWSVRGANIENVHLYSAHQTEAVCVCVCVRGRQRYKEAVEGLVRSFSQTLSGPVWRCWAVNPSLSFQRQAVVFIFLFINISPRYSDRSSSCRDLPTFQVAKGYSN